MTAHHPTDIALVHDPITANHWRGRRLSYSPDICTSGSISSTTER
jgi:hypothetical protein